MCDDIDILKSLTLEFFCFYKGICMDIKNIHIGGYNEKNIIYSFYTIV